MNLSGVIVSKDIEVKKVRSALAKSAFGTCAKNYLAAIATVSSLAQDRVRLSAISDILEADESGYSKVNVFRLSMIFRIRHILLNEPIPKVFTEKSRFLEQSGGALFDENIAGTLSSVILPYQILLPFGLAYGTSRQYFSEIEFNSNLKSADANLYRFFSKIGDNNFNRRTHAWVPQITRATREIYDNILNHAFHASHAPKYQYTEQHQRERSRFWFFGFRRFVYSDQSAYFSTLRAFQSYRLNCASPAKYYIVVNITDDGPGIVRYYQISSGKGDPETSLASIIEQKLSSTNIPGAGHGINNAISEVIFSKGYLQVESNSQIYCVYFDGIQQKSIEINEKSDVIRAGTSVDIVIPVF